MKKLCIFCLSLLTAMTVVADEWTLVTDPATLQAGDQIVLACNTEGATAGAYTTGKTSSYLAEVKSTFGGTQLGTITSLGAGSVVLTLGGQAGAWTFSLNGQLIGTSEAKKLKLGDGTTTWTISIIGGDATIASTNSNLGTIQFNKKNPRFTNYTSDQTKVQLYRSGSAAEKYALTYQGFPYKKTLCEEPTYVAGSKVRLSSGTKQREDGKWILGWEYQGVTYEIGGEFTMPEADVELVPVWGEKSQGVDHVQGDKAQWTKVLREGQLYLMYNGTMYNVQGLRVK